MQEQGTRQRHPELKKLVVEASQALALLDADRLQELTLSCQALNRGLNRDLNRNLTVTERSDLVRQAREAAHEMGIFARVLDATRANVKVMHRLREMRASRLEYSESRVTGRPGTESRHGDN